MSVQKDRQETQRPMLVKTEMNVLKETSVRMVNVLIQMGVSIAAAIQASFLVKIVKNVLVSYLVFRSELLKVFVIKIIL